MPPSTIYFSNVGEAGFSRKHPLATSLCMFVEVSTISPSLTCGYIISSPTESRDIFNNFFLLLVRTVQHTQHQSIYITNIHQILVYAYPLTSLSKKSTLPLQALWCVTITGLSLFPHPGMQCHNAVTKGWQSCTLLVYMIPCYITDITEDGRTDLSLSSTKK